MATVQPRGPCAKKGRRSLIRYVIAWVLMVFIAIANGALRQLTFGKSMTELRAHQLSTLIASVVLGLFIYAVIRNWPPATARQAVAIGLTWLLLTVVFEFGFGRLVMHRHWVQLFNDYNLFEGRVWVLFLAWLATAPYAFFKLRSAARLPAEAGGSRRS